jgi:hypothetical protein
MGRVWIRWGATLGSDREPCVVPGLHAPSEDAYRRKVVIP